MRLVTPGDSAPASVSRHLLPNEYATIIVRRHWAVLLRPALWVLGGLIVAGVLGSRVGSGNGLLLTLIWWGWLLLLVRLVWKVADWSVDYFVVTPRRMIWTYGLLTRKTAMMPLPKVTDMTFERTVLGRLLGYGRFKLETAGQVQGFDVIDYLPYPENLYLEISGMLFPSKDEGED